MARGLKQRHLRVLKRVNGTVCAACANAWITTPFPRLDILAIPGPKSKLLPVRKTDNRLAFARVAAWICSGWIGRSVTHGVDILIMHISIGEPVGVAVRLNLRSLIAAVETPVRRVQNVLLARMYTVRPSDTVLQRNIPMTVRPIIIAV